MSSLALLDTSGTASPSAPYPAAGFPDVLVSRLLKHANTAETIPKDTVRYVSRSLALARALQTQLLTRLL